MARTSSADRVRSVAATLAALRADGDPVVPKDKAGDAELAQILCHAWLDHNDSSLRRSTEALSKEIVDWANFDPLHDWPRGSYRYVAAAVIATIERGFHLDPLPPGATGFINDGQVEAGQHRQFMQTLFAAVGAEGWTAEREQPGVQSFEAYVLRQGPERTIWVLAHHVTPVFVATNTAPSSLLLSDFVDPQIWQSDWFVGWEFLSPRTLEAPLTPFLMARLTQADHRSIRHYGANTVGAAMFNLWD